MCHLIRSVVLVVMLERLELACFLQEWILEDGS